MSENRTNVVVEDANHARLYHDALNETVEKATDRADAWGLECFRALFVLNGAGLAGSAALAQVVEKSARHSLPITSFVLGIGLAFIGLVLGWAMHSYASDAWAKQRDKFAETFSKTYLALPNLLMVEVLWWGQVICGVASLILFCFGGSKLVIST
ncbi:hypothetical protein [Achromobacter xylosoxidans]|uniref:hypothetical protein n=1 Tax=Alcaligenes xylosoxydans xylosoxydans TaxID=85698 RepID=UPI000B494542|nr:hypothetical protein [Achromobacter xylosoxidans]